MGELSQLQGLGPKSEKMLNRAGVYSEQDLRTLGAVNTYLRVKEKSNPGLNLLYAIVGALEGKHWADIAREEKGRLLFELEGVEELEAVLDKYGDDIEK